MKWGGQNRAEELITLLCFGAALLAAPSAAQPAASLTAPQWTELAPGLEFARVEAEDLVRSGSRGMALVRIDPHRCRLEPYHEREFPSTAPSSIEVWQRRLGAPVVFNAGLYDEAGRHLGTLRREGKDLHALPHRVWKGLLAHGGPGGGGVFDLGTAADARRAREFPTQIQSMMLFDAGGRLRVRASERAAFRTVVAEDEEGRLVVLVSEGALTLGDTARLLQRSGLRLRLAMAFDGGRESNLAVEDPAVTYRSYQDAPGAGAAARMLRAAQALPAVIAVWPAAEPASAQQR